MHGIEESSSIANSIDDDKLEDEGLAAVTSDEEKMYDELSAGLETISFRSSPLRLCVVMRGKNDSYAQPNSKAKSVDSPVS